MTQEEKQLLLQDLCGRLPYGVICEIYNDTCTIKEKLQFGGISHFADDTICVRPYLRAMSSMTEEEEKEFVLLTDTMLRYGKNNNLCCLSLDAIQWLLKKHFDFMGLIPKGLAIEVTKENNPYEN